MSLPESYTNLLNELNKEVRLNQPHDSLQFCSNWFNKRLESERNQAKQYSFGSTSAPTTTNSNNSRSAPTVTSIPVVSTNASHSDSEEEEEVDDPRDDPNYHPSAKPGEIPSSYNLGRRTSVSAESLDPSAVSSNLVKVVIPKTTEQRSRIESSISSNLLFRNLDEDQYKDVINAMKEITVQSGTEVIVQGAVGDFFYVVEQGTFEVWVRPPPTFTYVGTGLPSTSIPGIAKKVAGYGPGGSFGELALMYNAPRAATVISTSKSTMWALDRVTFRSILMEHTSRKRKMYESFLGSVEILESLTNQERSKIADALEEKVYEEGESVIVEGEVGKNFYIVESGRAEVSKKDTGDRVLKVYGKGGYFGELALLNATPRAATVKAAPGHGKLRVATLGEKAFTRLLGPVIDILARKAETSYDSANLSPPSSTSSIQASVIAPVSISTGPTFNDSFNTGTFNNSRAESMEVDDRARRDEQFGPGGEDRRGIRAGSAGK